MSKEQPRTLSPQDDSLNALIEGSRNFLQEAFAAARAYLRAIVDRKIITQRERVEVNYSLPIFELSQSKFQKLYDRVSQREHIAIQMRWQRCSASEIVVNTGAGPCTIVFVHDKTNNQVLSAHYPTTTVDGVTDNTENLPPSPANFYSLLEELRTLKKEGAELEVYLFGNNVSADENTESDVLAIWTQRRQATTSAFESALIEGSDIHDLRPPIADRADVDHLIYLPDYGICFMRGNVLKIKLQQTFAPTIP